MLELSAVNTAVVEEVEHYAIFVMHPDGTVATWNSGAEAIKGYAAEEIIGTHYRTFFPEEAVEQRTPERLLARAESDGTVKGRGWRVRSDGSRFWADFTLTALHDDAGDLRGFTKVMQDVTAQREYQQQLERRNERLDEFVSRVSHDVKTPLVAAGSALELARETGDASHIDEASRAIDRSLAIVDDLLTLAREAESVGEESVDLAETVKWCWRAIGTTNETLVVETDRTIVAAPSRLKQVVDNFLVNAIEHGGEGVTVTVGDLDGGFYVADSGSGIPAADRDQVFDRGYSTSDGTGLGLHIVRERVAEQGWEIDLVESRDGGARFEVTGVEFAETPTT